MDFIIEMPRLNHMISITHGKIENDNIDIKIVDNDKVYEFNVEPYLNKYMIFRLNDGIEVYVEIIKTSILGNVQCEYNVYVNGFSPLNNETAESRKRKIKETLDAGFPAFIKKKAFKLLWSAIVIVLLASVSVYTHFQHTVDDYINNILIALPILSCMIPVITYCLIRKEWNELKTLYDNWNKQYMN